MINVFPIPTTTTIDYAHQKVHEGRYFSGGEYNAALANTTSLDLLIQGATQSTHTKFTVSTTGTTTVQIYTGTTFSVAGTSVAMSNHNRNSSKVFDATVTHTPTVTSVGTQINGTGLVPAGDKHTGGGGEFGFGNEFILAPSTNYLVRATNVSGGAIKISVSIEGYQPTL